jgi:hypothetical protein
VWGTNQERHQMEVFENKEHEKLKLQNIKKKKKVSNYVLSLPYSAPEDLKKLQ